MASRANDPIDLCNALYDTKIFLDPRSHDHTTKMTYQYAGFGALSLILVACLYYWLLYRSRLLDRGQVDRANRTYLFVYRNLIIIYVILVMIQLFVFILNVIRNETVDNFTTNGWSWYSAITSSITFVIPNAQMALCAFLFTKNTISYKAFQQGYRFAIPFSIIWFVANILAIDKSINSTTQSWVHIVIDSLFLLFCVYIVLRQCQYNWKRRAIVLKYLSCVMIIVSFDLIPVALALDQKDGGCISQFGFYVWLIIYPIIFFVTVKQDSDFWWTDASQPLMESTQESLQGLDLFNLPGYKEIHFDSDQDHKMRFKKLKQIVSGYVPLISFKKIKWDDNTKAPEDDVSSGTSSNGSNGSYDPTIEPSAAGAAGAGATDAHGDEFKQESKEAEHTNKNKNKNKNSQHDDKKESHDGKQKLGGGSTGVVFRGTYGKQAVAVKELTRLDKKTEMSWTDLTLIFRESILNSSLSHPNIVRFIGASLTYNAFYLVYEYCEYGDLQQIIVERAHPKNERLTCVKQRYWYLIDICKGMCFLHNNNFVHRDLKTANVVVTWSDKVKRYVGKICDFGVSRKLPKQQQHIMDINHSILSTSDSDLSKMLGGHKESTQIGDKKKYTLGADLSGDESVTGYEQSHTGSSAAGLGNLQPNMPFTTKEIERTIHVGTPAFLAPEILLKLVKSKGVTLRKKKKKRKGTAERGTLADHNVDPMIYCDFATDVYSFGMLMWSVITGKLPYKGFKPLDMIKMIYNGDRLKIGKREWQVWADEANIDSNELKNLLHLCWAQYPQDRPTFYQIDNILKNILVIAESHEDGAGIWPSSENGAHLLEREKSMFAFSQS